MSKLLTTEVLPQRLGDHRAVQAWRHIDPEWSEPEKIDILKLKSKTAVYRLSGLGRNGCAVIAKRCQATTAAVERAVYEQFLASLPMPALRCHGFVPEPQGKYCWLFLEDAGTQTYSPQSKANRALAGQWLGTVHRAGLPAPVQELLPDRDLNYHLDLLRLARAKFLEHADNRALLDEDRALLRTVAGQCDVIEAHWEELESSCADLPRTLVHGDFVIKNLRLRAQPTGVALLVFDWEMAGWGVPATDLAQFVGRTVSPDLEVYCAVLQQDYPQVKLPVIQQLAQYGNLLRVLDKIFWESQTMVGDSYEFLLKPLLAIQQYEAQLAHALQAVNWS